MLSMTFVFWALVGLFALVGAMRGWAKEILVTFTVILALFIYAIAITYLGPIKSLLAPPISTTEFWVLTFLFVILVLFGYQTPVLTRFASGKLRRERFTDAFLGFFLGAFNGYLIVGTIWYFMELANYSNSRSSSPITHPFYRPILAARLVDGALDFPGGHHILLVRDYCFYLTLV